MMGLRHLDLFLHLPDQKTPYSAKLEQTVMGSMPAPPIDKSGSTAAAIKIMETISKAQGSPLEKLTLHLARTGYEDRFQPYMMQGKMQVRRGTEDVEHEIRGRREWTWGLNALEEDIHFHGP